MKKNKFLFLMLILFMACSETSSTVTSSEVIEEDKPQEWHTGIGETPESFVSNWNILVNSISDDPQTIDFFSIKPDDMKWSSEAKTKLYYQFGTKNDNQNTFVLNLNVENEKVNSTEIFPPTTSNETTTQQTKLFFLIMIALSDDSLDKDQREDILSNLGLYDDISDPYQYGGSVNQNNIEYIIEPLVDKGLLVGINFYSSIR